MKKLFAIVMLAFMTACASNPSIKTSGDIPGQETIRVIGSGKTPEEAKRNGFRTAIEIVVGSAVVSEKDAYNNRLLKDQIIEHSAGYVDDYKIIDQYSSGSGVSMVMDVTVKNSVIASKLLNRNEPTNIDGTRLDAQYKTYLDERETGDAFLNTVLNDFPNRALTITQGKVDYMLRGNRESVFVIPYTVRWNYKYIQGLNEALSKVQDKNSDRYFDPRCMCYVSPERIVVMAKSPNDWLVGSKNIYHFNDVVRANNVANSLAIKPYIKISFIAHNGRVLQKECVGTGTIFAGKPDKGVLAIWGNAVEEDRINVVVKHNSMLYNNMADLNRIEMSLETFEKCNR